MPRGTPLSSSCRKRKVRKKDVLRIFGADLRLVPAKPYKDPGNYVRYSETLAKELAETHPGGVIWANQFDNANYMGHYRTTGPEIWRQTDGKIDGFTCAVGSGGTIAGVGRCLKEQNDKVGLPCLTRTAPRCITITSMVS